MLDAVSQRDRYQQFARTARELLADFREVEENFRRLDRTLREQIAGWTGSKGALLDEALGSRKASPNPTRAAASRPSTTSCCRISSRAELTDLLERLQQIQELGDQDGRLVRIHFDWIDASERTQATVRLLSEQLRRFLDDQVWLENRRVFDLLRSIEAKALRVRAGPTGRGHGARRHRRLRSTCRWSVRSIAVRAVHSLVTESMEHGNDDFDSSAMLSQLYVDREQLDADG